MITRNLLLATEAGLGAGETAIFPISIFKVKEGVNYNPEDPNYDLFKLAMRVSAKRLFPTYEFIDAPFNIQYYKPGDFRTELATMGCVDGVEKIKYSINDIIYEENFNDAWLRVSELFEIENFGLSEYCNVKGVKIYDTTSNGFVTCKKFIKNQDKGDWYRIVLKNDLSLLLTSDHPLHLKDKGRTFMKDILIGDFVEVVGNVSENKDNYSEVVKIEFLGNRGECSYDVETESDRFDVSGFASHNCRTRVIGNAYDPKREIVAGRGNLSFTSINLPRLGIEAHGDIDKFFELLDEKMYLVKRQLIKRFQLQGSKHVYNYPFLMGQGLWLDSENLGPSDTIEEVLCHGSLSIGSN